MEKDIITSQNYIDEILKLFRSGLPSAELLDKLSDYHDNDIADALEQLSEDERKKIYPLLGAERLSDIFSYLEDPDEFLQEMKLENQAELLSEMDSDDAVDVLEEMDDSIQEKLVGMMDDESKADIRLILSYDEDEIGSRMTTNYILIQRKLSVKQAMSELVKQAGENDNISTIYVEDNEKFYGAIDLKDLIIAREFSNLEDLIITSYPFLRDHDLVSENIERIKDYAEDSLPVLSNEDKLLGIITSQDIVEAVDDEMGEDYAKLAGLTAEEDLEETTKDSMKKRLPWLVALLFLGLGVSTVVGAFERVVAMLPLVICFQSLILDMAGNVGTQSLAVTIRVLMDENLTAGQKIRLVFKESRVGLANGLFLGILAFLFIGLYVSIFKGLSFGNGFLISLCVGVSLMLAILISSLVGTLVPLFFNKLGVDPAVASGPLITTVNDLVAVVTYYGLVWLFLIKLLGFGA